MGHYENIKIDRKDGWKFSNTHGTNGSDYYAKVYVDDKGEISKESFSREYNGKEGKVKEKKVKVKEKKVRDKFNRGEKKGGFLKKIFKALWWLTKKLFRLFRYLLTLGIIHSDEPKK